MRFAAQPHAHRFILTCSLFNVHVGLTSAVPLVHSCSENDLCGGRVLIGSALRWACVCAHRCVSGAPRKCLRMYMSACWQREPCRWGPGHGAHSSAPNMCSGLPSPSISASFEGPAEESAPPTRPHSNSLAFIHLTSSYLVRVELTFHIFFTLQG